MATAAEIQALIDAANERLVAATADNNLAEVEATDAEDRQRLRRELDHVNSKIDAVEQETSLARDYVEEVDDDQNGPNLPGLVANRHHKKPNSQSFLSVDEDIANCRYNVSKGGHTWKIEGISWLQNTLQQVYRVRTTSMEFKVSEAIASVHDSH
jgi:hypothetical protein